MCLPEVEEPIDLVMLGQGFISDWHYVCSTCLLKLGGSVIRQEPDLGIPRNGRCSGESVGSLRKDRIMDATRPRRTRDGARQRWYAQCRTVRFARYLRFPNCGKKEASSIGPNPRRSSAPI
jgi:hypothetical protein